MNIYARRMHKYELKVGVVGARGYSGLELLGLLSQHPAAKIQAVFGSEASKLRLSDLSLSSALPDLPILPASDLESVAKDLDLLFLATPAETSIQLAKKAIGLGLSVIDLSGAFRLEAATYPKSYGFEHEAPELLKIAQYGLVPFCGPIASATRPHLIANPGCYATACLMALIPISRSGVVDSESWVIDAKSGASGAGRKASEDLLFCEVDGECAPYRVGKHQHLPEIERFSSVKPQFTTHLLGTKRGISAALYGRILPGISDSEAEARIEAEFKKVESDYRLLNAAKLGESKRDRLALSLAGISGSPETRIRFRVQDGRIYCFSLIDNLLKGAASQAIENMNRILDLDLAKGVQK